MAKERYYVKHPEHPVRETTATSKRKAASNVAIKFGRINNWRIEVFITEAQVWTEEEYKRLQASIIDGRKVSEVVVVVEKAIQLPLIEFGRHGSTMILERNKNAIHEV